MPRTSDARVSHTRENSVFDDLPLFSLPNGEPASFLLHNFENVDLTKRIFEHGGRITKDDAIADVILTTNKGEYAYLKDRYAISRKTYVHMSGFVDRCIDSGQFKLAPIPEKGVPGRRPMSRRTEFTSKDDEHLCQYIAEVLPDKGEGGRTGHFIYDDLLRRAEEFGQYDWALRHPKNGWRERYRKNQERLDTRIARIVEINPPSDDGKGQYMFRRHGKIAQDDELNADEEVIDLDAEERRDSATDNEDGPVQTKKVDAQRQEEEEEEEEEGEGQAVMHRPGARSDRRNRDPEPQEEEGIEEQAAERQTETGPRAKMASRQSRVSLGEAPGPKRRRKRVPAALEEPSTPDDIDATLRGDAEVDNDKLAEEPEPTPLPSVEVAIGKGSVKRTKPRGRPVVPPLSPRRTRARSRSQSVDQPDGEPVAPRTTRARAKALATVTATAAAPAALGPVPESQVSDEFMAHSDDDEVEMHEVEHNLQVSVQSRGLPAEDHMRNSHTAEDLFTSGRLRSTDSNDAAIIDLSRNDPDNSDSNNSDEAELLAKMGARTRLPTAKGGKGDRDRDRDRHDSSEETFPSPGTRAGEEKKRLTQAAKDAPYVPPIGTRAAAMVEKEGARARRAPATAVRRR